MIPMVQKVQKVESRIAATSL